MTRYGDWNAHNRALLEETQRRGAPYYQLFKKAMETKTHKERIEEEVSMFAETWDPFIGDIEFGPGYEHLASDPEVPLVLPEICNDLRLTILTLRREMLEERVKKMEWMLEPVDMIQSVMMKKRLPSDAVTREIRPRLIKNRVLQTLIEQDKVELQSLVDN